MNWRGATGARYRSRELDIDLGALSILARLDPVGRSRHSGSRRFQRAPTVSSSSFATFPGIPRGRFRPGVAVIAGRCHPKSAVVGKSCRTCVLLRWRRSSNSYSRKKLVSVARPGANLHPLRSRAPDSLVYLGGERKMSGRQRRHIRSQRRPASDCHPPATVKGFYRRRDKVSSTRHYARSHSRNYCQ